MANRNVRSEQSKEIFGNDEEVYGSEYNNDKLVNKSHQWKEVFNQTLGNQVDGEMKDFSLDDIRFSEKEWKSIRIKDRYPAIEVAKLIRFEADKAYKDYLDLGMTPYLVLPIECIGKKGIHWITCIAPTQSGKTAFLQVFVADSIDQSPGNMLYIMPTGKTAERGYNDKIISMIEATPELYEHVLQPKDDNLLRTISRLDNMCIYPVTAGSLGELSSITCTRIAIDELRLMGVQTGKESNVVKLTEDRLTVFLPEGLGQGASVSSPSTEGDLLHLQTTKPYTVVLHWYTECPHCNRMQKLDFFINMFIDPATNLPRAHRDIKCPPVDTCHCKFCGGLFDDSDQKRSMNKTGKYGVEGLDGIHINNFPEPKMDRYVVFWWNSMNSPFRSFKDIYMAYISALVCYEDMINFLIAWCAEFLKNEVTSFNLNLLKERVSTIPQGIIPEWTKVITCGMDTQDMRFYYVCEAWGNVHQSHIFDYGTVDSNIHEETNESVHELLLEYFENRIYLTEDEIAWAIGLYAIDMGGHKTKTLHSAIKGLKKCIKCFGRGRVDGIKYQTAGHYHVNTDEFLLKTDMRPLNPNFSIFAGEHEEFFRQISNVKRNEITDKKTGRKETQWVRNGQFDYRMAFVHSSIALHVGVGKKDNTFYNKLNQDDFIYNPAFLIRQKEANNAELNKSEVVKTNRRVEENRRKSFSTGGYSM